MIGDSGKFDNYKKTTTPVYSVPKTVQQTIPIYKIAKNGVFQIEPSDRNKKSVMFDKCYKFEDINYMDLGDSEQQGIAISYCNLLNFFPDSFKVIIVNRNVNKQEIDKKVLYDPKPGYEELTEAYNELNTRRVRDANGIVQEKYIVATCHAKDLASANTQFANIEANLTNHFKSLGSSIRPLNVIERLKVLHDFYNLGHEDDFHLTEKDLSGRRDWKNDICPTYMKENMDCVEIDNRFVQTIFTKMYPTSMDDDFITEMTSLPYNMIATLDCSPIPNGVTERMLMDALQRVELNIEKQQEYRNKHNQFSTDITYEVTRKKEEIIDNLDEMSMNNAKMFYGAFTICVQANSFEEMRQASDRICTLASERMIIMKPYRGRQIAAMNTALPTGTRQVNIMRSMFTQVVGAHMPFHTQELDEDGGVIYGVNQVSKQILRGNRKLLTNGNGFIFGSTGYGKSVNAKMEMGQVLVNTDDDLIVIDPQNEYFDICRQWNGQVINLSERSHDYMNPFDIPDRRNIENVADFIAEKFEFAMAICKKAIDPMPFKPIYRSIIDKAVRSMYYTVFSKGLAEPPTFVTFRDELKKNDSEDAKELADILEVFTDGSLALFSHQSNVNVNNRFIVYGINDLGQNLRPLALLIMIENVKNRISSNARKGKATWVYIDECHTILDDDYGLATFEKLWKEVRKKGGLLTGITQNVIDCLVNKKTRTIISNSEYISMLSQSEFEQDVFEDILPISESQFRYITNAPRGTGVMKYGEKLIPFDNTIPKDMHLYDLFNTNLHEKIQEGKFKKEEKTLQTDTGFF